MSEAPDSPSMRRSMLGLGGVLLANMLEAWLDGEPSGLPTGEAVR